MTELQENDLDIKPVHTINGHGLWKLVGEEFNEKEEEEVFIGWEQDIDMYNIEKPSPTSDIKSWYADVHQYLEHNTMPSHFSI